MSKQPQDNSVEAIFGNKVDGVAWAWNGLSQLFEVAAAITSTKGFWIHSTDDFLDDDALIISVP